MLKTDGVMDEHLIIFTNCHNFKFFFLAASCIAITVLLILRERISFGTIRLLHVGLFEKDLDVEGAVPKYQSLSDNLHVNNEHDAISRIPLHLHESIFGAPEFDGHNFIEETVYAASSSFLNHLQRYHVAIGCAITMRNQEDLHRDNIAAQLPFFKGLLGSFCTTSTKGFNYHFYVSHDNSEPFFKIPGSHDLFREVFEEVVNVKCPRRINATLHLVNCQHSGKPAWAQNDAMMAAYLDNMDYYYRVNDDTVMETPGWTEKFIEELIRFRMLTVE